MRSTARLLARFSGPAALGAVGLWLWLPPLHAAEAENRLTDALWQSSHAGAPVVLVVSGPPAAELIRAGASGWSVAEWQQRLAVFVDGAPPGAPAMAGTYAVRGDNVVFTPAFPLARDAGYRAELRRPDQPSSPPLVHRYSNREFAGSLTPPATVTHVYPSAEVLPENLLKFYIHFSAPMNGGDIYRHLKLLDQDGHPVFLPFLELGEELWNPQMTRVTVFIDPGRIKRGVRELMEHGPALTPGQSHTLVIESTWTDGQGRPLREAFRKTFRAGPADRTAIDPATWRLTAPAAGTREALQIVFPEPLDHALAERLIQVATVAGDSRRLLATTATLSDQERRLSLVPEQPWTAGSHELVIPTILEDLAGNKVGKVFDVDVFDEVQRSLGSESTALPFAIR